MRWKTMQLEVKGQSEDTGQRSVFLFVSEGFFVSGWFSFVVSLSLVELLSRDGCLSLVGCLYLDCSSLVEPLLLGGCLSETNSGLFLSQVCCLSLVCWLTLVELLSLIFVFSLSPDGCFWLFVSVQLSSVSSAGRSKMKQSGPEAAQLMSVQ